jgi:signal transduction histidine kinase
MTSDPIHPPTQTENSGRRDFRASLEQLIGYSEKLVEEARHAGQAAILAVSENIRQEAQALLKSLDQVPAAPAMGIAGAAAETVFLGEYPGNILLVDDNASNRDLLARRLERQGHLISMAENGAVALAMLQESRFDLVLLDIMMPEMDGYELLARMKADPPLSSIPVIMITALTEMESVVRCIEMGAEDYLSKPFNPALLRARIGATLQKKRLRELEQMHREQVIQAEAMLERHRALAQMVAGVAHEINTPLGIASTALSIMENRFGSLKMKAMFNTDEERAIFDDLLESLDLMKNNIIRAHNLVESFKKISVREVVEKQELVNLPELLSDCIELFKINARKAKLTVSLNTAKLQGSPEWLGYPGQMTQVVMNLLQNVERYAYPDSQGGVVEICLADQGEQFVVCVSDEGQGICQKNLSKVFEPFYTTGRGKGGTGLGLAIVDNIVTTLFKGRIDVASEPAKGCRFMLTFPKKPVQ